MRAVVVCGEERADELGRSHTVPFELAGERLWCAEADVPDPEFPRDDPAYACVVRVRVLAFSCNYRDRGKIHAAVREGRVWAVGSEFVGIVEAVGPAVEGLAEGDRVIGDNAYPITDGGRARPGLPTTHASLEILMVDAAKLIRVPPAMPTAVAAGFSIGAQTAYSMVSKLPEDGRGRVLVTAGRSNTSLFALAALRAAGGYEVVVATSASSEHHRLLELGADAVVQLPKAGGAPGGQSDAASVLDPHGPFDAILDPFWDVHMAPILDRLRNGAVYVTCGYLAQGGGGSAPPPIPTYHLMSRVLVGNLSLVGNCLGTRAHLEQALDDYVDGRLPVVVDSVWNTPAAADFLTRSFDHADRFGKVVYSYV